MGASPVLRPTPLVLRVVRRLLYCRWGHELIVHRDGYFTCVRCLSVFPTTR